MTTQYVYYGQAEQVIQVNGSWYLKIGQVMYPLGDEQPEIKTGDNIKIAVSKSINERQAIIGTPPPEVPAKKAE